MKRLTPVRAFLLGLVLVASVTYSQTVVNQGKPGTQGPWPVTLIGGTGGGTGGSSGAITVSEQPCTQPVESILVFDGGGASPCPIVALSGRRSVTICNSPKNSGSPLWTVRADGLAPTISATSPGQTLGVADCISYMITATSTDGGVPTNCISDTGNSVITITECK